SFDGAAVVPAEPTIQPLQPSAASVARSAARAPATAASPNVPPPRSPWRALGWVGAVLLPLVATFAFGLWWFDSAPSAPARTAPAGAATTATTVPTAAPPPVVRSVSGATGSAPAASEPDDGSAPVKADAAAARG